MKKINVLVVEDESIVAEDIRRTLEKLGYMVPSVVSSGEMALEKIKEKDIDIVFMDIVLKGEMDGIETASQIRSRFNIPVVYLTAYSDEKILQRAKITEPFGYIIKPFKEREIKINIEIALYKHRIENELKESKKFYESVLEGIVSGVWVTDRNDTISYANKGLLTIMGLKPKQIVGIHVLKDFPEFFRPYYIKAKESLQPFYYQAVPFAFGGKDLSYQSGWLIPRIKDGNFDGMICTVESIPKYNRIDLY
ncbi:MAG TPA: response regulator [Candidatus Methanoperedens sp.]